MRRVILTGADGFLGTHAIRQLLELGFEVHAVSNVAPADDLRFENVVWHKVDLLNLDELQRFVRRIKASHLLHFAWYVEHGKFWSSNKNDLWVAASHHLFESFLENGGTRIVGVGSCAEYGLDTGEELREETSPLEPGSVYGKSKLQLQRELSLLTSNWAWGRIFFLYGEKEHYNRLVPSVINSLLRGETARCSHGRQIRDYMYVRDVASAFVALLESEVTGSINIASGKPTTIRNIVCEIARIMNVDDGVEFGAIAVPENEPIRITGNTRRLQVEVNWRPKFRMTEGLTNTINWWRTQQDTKAENK